MHLRVSKAHIGLVICLSMAFVLAALPQAFGATVTRGLPFGSRVTGVLASEGEHDWNVVVRKGQSIEVTLRTMAGYSGQAWVAAFDSLATTNTAEPLSDLGVVSGVGSSHLSFTVPYDTLMTLAVLAPTPSHGAYSLEYVIGDPPVTSAIERIGGTTRFSTAIRTSQSVFATGSATTAVVASGLGFADALAASGLAGSYDCPVLLTDPLALSAGVNEEISRLGATSVFVVGGPAAVSDSVFNALKQHGRTVSRISGGDRFATAAAIAEQIRLHEIAEGRTPSTEAFVVNGLNYPDALSVSPYAFAKKMPILLVRPTLVPAATADALDDMSATTAYVIGGETAVSGPAAEALSVETTRLAGSDRLLTAIAAADFAVAHGWANWSRVGIATGYNYPDALAAGPALGKQGGVMLLCKPTTMAEALYATLYSHRAAITGVQVFGGTGAVWGSVVGGVDRALVGDVWVNPYGFNYTGH